MLRQAADQGYKLNLMMGDSIATSEFWQISGPAGEGTLFTFPSDPRRSPNAAKALEQFKAQGFDPEGFTLFSYGVVQAIAEGIKRAGSDDPKAVAKALENGQPVETVLGRSGSTARAISSTPATTSTSGAPANTRPSWSSEAIEPDRRTGVRRGQDGMRPHAVSSTKASISASNASGVSHCGACPAPGIICTAPRHSVGMATEPK